MGESQSDFGVSQKWRGAGMFQNICGAHAVAILLLLPGLTCVMLCWPHTCLGLSLGHFLPIVASVAGKRMGGLISTSVVSILPEMGT